jgi:hypothetical protein
MQEIISCVFVLNAISSKNFPPMEHALVADPRPYRKHITLYFLTVILTHPGKVTDKMSIGNLTEKG